jgi:hypothetical protein
VACVLLLVMTVTACGGGGAGGNRTNPHQPAGAAAVAAITHASTKQSAVTACGNRVRMALTMTSPRTPMSSAVRAFARSGATATERSVYRASLRQYFRAVQTSGAARAAAAPSLSFRGVLRTCRAAAR